MASEPNLKGESPTNQVQSEPCSQKKKKNKSWSWINKEWSATIIFSGTILLIIAFLFNRHELFGELLSYIFDVLRPILIGLSIAFVLYKPACRMEDFLRTRCQKKFPRMPIVALSVLGSYLMLLLILAIVIWIVVPSFASSIMDFTDNIIIYYNNLMDFLNSDNGEQILNFLKENGFDPSLLRS